MRILLIILSFLYSINAYAQVADNSVDITSDNLEVERQTGKAVFSGNVKALYQNMTLQSDVLEISYDKAESKDKITSILATGSVYLEQGKDKVKADKANYKVADNEIVFTGNVVLNRNGNVLEGDHLTMDTVTNKAKMKSNGDKRVKAVYFKN